MNTAHTTDHAASLALFLTEKTGSCLATWKGKLPAADQRARGFLLVSATPLTRSSYHADADFAKLQAARGAKLASRSVPA